MKEVNVSGVVKLQRNIQEYETSFSFGSFREVFLIMELHTENGNLQS